MDLSLGHIFVDLFKFGDVHFQIFVPLELVLHGHNVLGVSDLALVSLLEVLLELVELRPQLFPLVLDIVQPLLDVCLASETVLLDYCFPLTYRQINIDDFVVAHGTAR